MIYSDLGNNPQEQPLVVDPYSVFQAITNLFCTKYQERLFRPQIWLDLDQLLFEDINPITSGSIYAQIMHRLPLNEPRIDLRTDLSYVEADPDNHRYKVAMFFNIRGLDDDTFEYFGTLSPPRATS